MASAGSGESEPRPSSRRPSVALVAWKVVHGVVPDPAVVRLAAEHVDFTVVTTELADELRPLVRWRRVPAPRAAWGRLTWAAFFSAASARLRGVRADLVHTVGPAPMVRARIDVATVVFCHSLYHEALAREQAGAAGLPGRAARAFSLGLERSSYRPGRVRLLTAECPSAARSLERHFDGLEATVLPTPIDTARFRPDADTRATVRRELEAGPDETVALFVGRDWELKGLAVAIRGLAEAARLGDRRLALWALGAGNVPRYRAIAEDAGVADRVRFLGFRRDAERVYQAADVFVLPTLCEMFCRAAYEAAASGLAVVATPVHGVTELVGDSEAGLLVERDPASVGAALARLAADPNLRARLGDAGRRRSSGHTAERCADALLATYRRLLEPSPATDPARVHALG